MDYSRQHDAVKKRCPYMEKCYRKNPIHFSEMSHPHLERIVIDQLAGEIKIPANLDFECSDRSLLIDQLKVLQMVLRKEKEKNGGGLAILSKDSNVKDNTLKPSTSSTNNIHQSIKDKVEKHKQVMAQRRENKLNKMDDEAKELFQSSSTDKSSVDNKKVHTMKEELDEIEIIEVNVNKANCSQGNKRCSDSSNVNGNDKKKSKSNSHSDRSVREHSSSTTESSESSQSSTSLKGVSIIDMYQKCDSVKTREEVRQKAIKMMKQSGYDVSVVEPGNFALKYAMSAPYHIFFPRVQKSKETYDQQFSITFPEILDISLGEIVASLQINFMVDVGWLCLQYLLAGQSTDMLILYGDRVDTEKLHSNITMKLIKTPSNFGCHHSKIMILKYKDGGIRIVVSTANLYADDWDNRTQGLWMSPHLPPLPESANTGDGESPTGFRMDFTKYLFKYREPDLTEWVSAVRRADFSEVNVVFVASVPGSHRDVEFNSWGHKKLGLVLSKHATLPPDAPQWPIVAQSSSIGSLGPSYDSWLLKEVVPSMCKETTKGLKATPKFQFVYPSINNYKKSFDSALALCCLPYGMRTHSKQKWFESYLYQWKASRTARDRAVPHIKSYTRFSPDFKRIPWFVLTSANLSKAAWGSVGSSNYILSFEAGVVFIPKFITGKTTFPIQEEEADVPVFPIIYDLPLTPYEPGDTPFVMDFFSQE